MVLEQGRKPVIRIGRFTAAVDPESASWTGKSLVDLFVAGDIGKFEVVELDPDALTMSVKLDQEPLAEGALLALESRTGQIKAMVGGFDFERSKFNRATQARRQPGSAFKPFAAGAAIEEGYTAASLILDEPVRYVDPHIAEAYEPKNYDMKYEGWVTLRRMIEASRNVPAVRLTQQLGPQKVADYARRLGLEGPIPPYLSITLGAAEATLLEMVSAYSAFANQGIRMQPYFVKKVTDRDGNVLEEAFPKAASAIRADSAYIVTNLLRGVVQRGTAAAASRLGRPLAGKTGTTNDYTDAWFIGYDPTLVAGHLDGIRSEDSPRRPRDRHEDSPRSLDRLHGRSARGQTDRGFPRSFQYRFRPRGPQDRLPGVRGGNRASTGGVHLRNRAHGIPGSIVAICLSDAKIVPYPRFITSPVFTASCHRFDISTLKLDNKSVRYLLLG